MKKILVLIFLSLFTVIQLIAQEEQTIVISGRVIDSTSNQPLEYATVVLKRLKSDDLFGIITDKNGNFNLSVEKGVYTISFEFLSYTPITFTNYKITNNEDFETIKLSVSSESLNAVEINGNSNLVDFKLGKKTYYVEKDISANSGTATDVLTNVPSVTLNSSGVPLIRGVEAKVLLNGRISSMSKVNALNNLQASSIKKIEVITNPSAKYGGFGSGGIINIILKKGLDNGFNGSITSTTGIKDIYGAAASLNYRKNNLNIYTNTSYFHREPISKATIDNEYFSNNTSSSSLNQKIENSRENIVFNSSLGLDYYINDYITLNVEGSYANYNGNFFTSNISSYLNSSNQLTSKTEQLMNTDHRNEIFEIATTYDHYFQRERENLYFTFSYSNDIEKKNSVLIFNELFPIPMPLPHKNELIFDDLKVDNTYWYAAYVFPTDATATLEFGYEANIGKVENTFLNEIISDGGFEPDPNTSNKLHYKENWHGVYSEFKKDYENFSFGAALRVEHTTLDINLVTTNERKSQKYTDLLPSLHLKFEKNEENSISFSYRRGIFRVSYPDLNPFEQRISETTSFQGNINLLPFYANTFELSFLNEKETKFTFNPSIYFKNYNDIWQYITVETGEIVNGVPKLLTSPVNLGQLNFSGIEFVSYYVPNDKLEFNATIDFRYVQQTGKYEYTDSNNNLIVLDYNDSDIGGSAKLNTSIKLPHNMNFQSLIQYNLPSEGAYSKRYGYTYMNASVNKELFDKKATLTLSANDIFNSNKTKRLRWTDAVNSKSNFQWREPSLVLSFTYRFNQSKKNGAIDILKKDEEKKY